MVCEGIMFLIGLGIDGVQRVYGIEEPPMLESYVIWVLLRLCNVCPLLWGRGWCEVHGSLLKRVKSYTDWHGDCKIVFSSAGLSSASFFSVSMFLELLSSIIILHSLSSIIILNSLNSLGTNRCRPQLLTVKRGLLIFIKTIRSCAKFFLDYQIKMNKAKS